MSMLQRPVSCVNIVIIIPARNVSFSIEYLFLNLCVRKRMLCHVTDFSICFDLNSKFVARYFVFRKEILITLL